MFYVQTSAEAEPPLRSNPMLSIAAGPFSNTSKRGAGADLDVVAVRMPHGAGSAQEAVIALAVLERLAIAVPALVDERALRLLPVLGLLGGLDVEIAEAGLDPAHVLDGTGGEADEDGAVAECHGDLQLLVAEVGSQDAARVHRLLAVAQAEEERGREDPGDEAGELLH